MITFEWVHSSGSPVWSHVRTLGGCVTRLGTRNLDEFGDQWGEHLATNLAVASLLCAAARPFEVECARLKSELADRGEAGS